MKTKCLKNNMVFKLYSPSLLNHSEVLLNCNLTLLWKVMLQKPLLYSVVGIHYGWHVVKNLIATSFHVYMLLFWGQHGLYMSDKLLEIEFSVFRKSHCVWLYIGCVLLCTDLDSYGNSWRKYPACGTPINLPGNS